MRGKKDDQVAIIWYMCRESIVADFANKRNPRETSHVETLTSASGEPIVETGGVVVDLVGAHAAGKQRIPPGTALTHEGIVDALVHVTGLLSHREVLGNLLHGCFLD